MDIEHLNKSQIILLTLFVSFVTSIATGIVTVSLVNQAPPQVATTVNHVIEHTVQQIVPSTQTASAATSATTKTVVVQDDDLAGQSIAAVEKSIIRIINTSSPNLLVARGLIIDSKGVAMTDRGSLDPSQTYEAILPGGTRVPLTVRSSASTTPVSLLDLTLGTSTPPLTAISFADPSKVMLGETVLCIGGTGGDVVNEGVIASLPVSEQNSDSQIVEASVTSTTPGSVLIDLYGNVIGMTTTDSQVQGNDFYSIPSFFQAAATAAAASTTAATVASQ
ncbi:MAG: trypsin-like peptidase domain-containing protein [Patescibacteria group bacterium]|nr:trypsin-like peptidase domain-containing protein [Patescibacteria group bacterium]